MTISVALLFSAYLLLDPAKELATFMQLTAVSLKFKVFVLVLIAGGFACALFAESRALPQVAKGIGKVHDRLWPHRKKQRKEYKILLEKMRI